MCQSLRSVFPIWSGANSHGGIFSQAGLANRNCSANGFHCLLHRSVCDSDGQCRFPVFGPVLDELVRRNCRIAVRLVGIFGSGGSVARARSFSGRLAGPQDQRVLPAPLVQFPAHSCQLVVPGVDDLARRSAGNSQPGIDPDQHVIHLDVGSRR